MGVRLHADRDMPQGIRARYGVAFSIVNRWFDCAEAAADLRWRPRNVNWRSARAQICRVSRALSVS